MKPSFCFALLLAAFTPALAASPTPLPVKEVTVFKDGHAFVVHQGALPVNASGEVVLDRLPAAVLGTFWAGVTDPTLKLTSVTARSQRLTVPRTALTVRELLEANVGAEAFLAETNGQRYAATLLGFPTRSSEELAATAPPGAPPRLAQRGDVVLLKVPEGVRALEVSRIQEVTFRSPPKAKLETEEFRPSLALELESKDGALPAQAGVQLMYVQRGLRWIPSYRVDLDGQGQAKVRLQATLLNELIDLHEATVQLVIGVPTFTCKDTLDPMGLQEAAAQLSAYFQSPAGRAGRFAALANNFDNGLMTQVAFPQTGDARLPAAGGAPGEPDLPEGTRNEDLFVFTLPHLTLKKGERMVVPIAEYSVAYEDVFALDVAFAPPTEMARSMNSDHHAELNRLAAHPRVLHKARLHNRSPYPFTTAPALVLREGRVVSQGIMTYAAVGADTDLPLTTALDLQVRKTDRETKRSPNSYQQNGRSYLRVDLEGSLRLVNRKPLPVRVEVARHVLGHVDQAGHEGRITMSNVFESRDHLPAGALPGGAAWWEGVAWPWWWHQVNGLGRIEWTCSLPAGESVELPYAWHYFWE